MDYKTFLGLLREQNGTTPLALYQDNLSVHRSDDSRMKMAELDIRPIWNPVYSPEFNPIEMAFAQVKAAYKKEKLRRLAHGIEFNHNEVVYQAFGAVTRQNVGNYVRHCEAALHEKAVWQ